MKYLAHNTQEHHRVLGRHAMWAIFFISMTRLTNLKVDHNKFRHKNTILSIILMGLGSLAIGLDPLTSSMDPFWTETASPLSHLWGNASLLIKFITITLQLQISQN